MLYDNIIEEVKAFARLNYESDDIHGFPHVERVYQICMRIGSELNANVKILGIAALLHDIGRKMENTNRLNRNHAALSAKIARTYLNSCKFDLNQTELDSILHCINTHSFSNKNKPDSLEAKILSDADKLDAIGAIGLYRTIGFTVKNEGGLKEVINHLEEKILKLKDILFLPISEEIATERHEFINIFYRKIQEEK
ncbi:MAG: HD domain-containing protein [Promethearchaeota archaeon]